MAEGELAFRSELVGRATELDKLVGLLDQAVAGRGRVAFIGGEAGIGKSRLLEELTGEAAKRGFQVLSGACFHEALTPYSAWVEATQKGGLEYLFMEEPLRVESLYVVDKAGLVLARAERSESPLDPDIFTSMIRVVEEFLQDTVRMAGGKQSKAGLSVLGIADYRIFLQQAANVTAIAVLTGRENEFLVQDMQDILQKVDEKYGAILKDWSGTLEDIAGMDEILKPVIVSKKYEGIDYARGDAQIRRNRLFESVSLGLARASHQAPILVTLDDLQWADPSSVALVHYVARGVRNARVLLVGTYRTEELASGLRGAKHPLEETIQLMSREGLHEEVRIRRLDETQTTRLVESLLGKVDLAAEEEKEVFRHSGGNPFFLIELARLVVQEGLLVRDGDIWRFSKTFRQVEIPTRVYNVVLRRLQRVGTEHRDVLELAAVLGDEFPVDILAQCLGKDRLGLLKMLRELEGTHQLVKAAQAKYRFDHPQVREVLLREMPDGIRMEYHRICGETYERAYGERLAKDYRALAEVAYHFYEARDSDKGARYSLQAAASAKQAYANEEAIRFYSQAIDLMGPDTPATERALAFESRGDERELLGRYEEAIGDYRQVQRLVRDQPELVARMHRKVGGTHWRRGAYAEADRELEAGLQLLGDATVAEVGQIELLLGRTASGQADMDRAMTHYRRAKAVLEEAPDRDELDLAEAQYSAGMVHYYLANREPSRMGELMAAARDDFTQCMETRRKRGDELGMRSALNMLANTYAIVGDFEKAVAYYEESLRIGERVGDLWGITKPLINLGRIYRLQGDGEAALATYLRALGILLKIGDQHGLASVYLNAAEVYLSQGEYGPAEDYFLRCRDIAERIGDKVRRAGALEGLGEVHLERSAPKEAADCLAKAVEAFEGLGAWEYACRSAQELMRAHILLDAMDAAKATVERAWSFVRAGKTGNLEGMCHAMEATIHRLGGRAAESEASLAASEAAYQGPIPDGDLAEIEFERALLLKKQGRASEAGTHFDKAADAARRAGRLGLAARAEGAKTD